MKDYFGYEGKKCVITGPATGMGKTVVEMLLDLGAEVYTLGHSSIVSNEVKKNIYIDLGSKEAIDEAFKELPNTFDKFFGIAGVGGVKEDFNLTVKVNFLANKYITDKYLIDRINPDGAIAYMSSLGGIGWIEYQDEFKDIANAKTYEEAVMLIEAKNASIGMKGYVFAKRALIYYSKMMVPVFANKNVRINTISPGITKTPLLDKAWLPAFGAENIEKGNLGAVDRYAQPHEMGQPIVFINSDMASYISGEDIKVDYGFKGLRDINNPNNLPYAGFPTL